MPPITSPTRRVLGEKNANASLNVTSPRKSQKTSVDSKPHVPAQIQSRILSGAINALSSSPRTGQKRRINEVEGIEARDWDERIPASQATDVVSDSASEADQMDTSMLSARSAADTTMTSFGISESQENPVEQQFEILEPEMSQRTLDKIHAVALPQNTSQPSQLQDRPSLMQNTSLDSVAMSKFLNFQSDGSSQGSDGLNMIEASLEQNGVRKAEVADDQSREKETNEDDKRRYMMEEKAAQLRTRLQLAFFKVETRQTNTPFSRLRIPESHRRKSESPPSLPPLPPNFHHRPSHSVSSTPNDRTGFSPEARIAALRAQAAMQRKPAVRALNSLPMPDIRPTAFSARWADDDSNQQDIHGHPQRQTPPQNDGGRDPVVQIPSSPPISNQALHIHEDETAADTASRSRVASSASIEVPNSPALPTPKSPAIRSEANEQSIPPSRNQGDDNAVAEGPVAEDRPASDSDEQAQPRARRLTNSAVKGEAASGLLQLMRGGLVNASNVRGPMCGL